MHATICALTLAGALAGANIPGESPKWHTDYAKAYLAASKTDKPLAVFLSPGKTDHDGAVAGELTDNARKLLGSSYVCVHVDTATDAGRELAAKFELADTGLVVSDRGGKYQQFSHPGTIPAAELEQKLNSYATQGAVVVPTAAPTVTYSPAPAYTPPAAPAPTYAPAPVMNYRPTYAPTYAPSPAWRPSGYCPNCR